MTPNIPQPTASSSSTAELLRAVRRVGRYDWLGGYTHALLVDDGEVIGPECIAPNYRALSWSTRHHAADGWEVRAVIALDGTDDPAGTHCAHCGRELEAGAELEHDNPNPEKE